MSLPVLECQVFEAVSMYWTLNVRLKLKRSEEEDADQWLYVMSVCSMDVVNKWMDWANAWRLLCTYPYEIRE